MLIFSVYSCYTLKEVAMSFGGRLKETRERYGWSAMVLAKQAGIPYETIYRVEKGRHEAPRLDIVKKLATTLGVSIDYLAGLSDDPQPGRRKRRVLAEEV